MSNSFTIHALMNEKRERRTASRSLSIWMSNQCLGNWLILENQERTYSITVKLI